MTQSNYTVEKSVDCKGLACPMPVVRAKKEIDGIQEGEILEILATDPGSVKDVPAWSSRVGHEFLETIEDGNLFRHYIRKSKKGETQS